MYRIFQAFTRDDIIFGDGRWNEDVSYSYFASPYFTFSLTLSVLFCSPTP